MPARILKIVAIVALIPSLADAQDRAQTRHGVWFNGGLGYGSASCDGCNGRESGLTIALAVGGTVSPRVVFGASVDSWTETERGSLTIAMLLARLRFYPSATSGFFVTAGVGLGTVKTDATDIGSRMDMGTGALIGLGYDIPVGANVSLTPFWNGFSTGAIDTNRNVGQLGLSLTVH